MAHARHLTLFVRLALVIGALFATAGCTDEPDDGSVRLKIKGETFTLEPALDHATRAKGLGDRRELGENEGMIFVFTRAMRQSFYMKDCYIDIDIAYLDDTGRVVTIHEMKKEEPKREDETEMEYVSRLKMYPSRYPSSIVIEVLGGRFADVGLVEGDVIDLDIRALKARAQ